jgi:hypothetical protein
VVGLTILITGAVTTTAIGPVIGTGITVTMLGVLATAATGYRAVQTTIRKQVADADTAALVRAVIQHDTQLITAPSNGTVVVDFEAAARRPRETAT